MIYPAQGVSILHYIGGRNTSIYGSTRGLKPLQIKRLQRIGHRKVKTDQVISFELARLLTELSREIKKQLGILVGRDGAIHAVIIGDHRQIVIPDLAELRTVKRHLRGLRLVHTHLKDEALSTDDLSDLALLRLDMIAAIGVLADGLPGRLYLAHLLPPNPQGALYEIHKPIQVHQLQLALRPFLEELEAEFEQPQTNKVSTKKQDRAILISASRQPRIDQEHSMDELNELACSAGLVPIDRVTQRPRAYHPKYLLGVGKLKEVIMKALQQQADLLIFDQNLSPLQVKTIGEVTEMKVLDRTQLILDIFAQRAHSREAKMSRIN